MFKRWIAVIVPTLIVAIVATPAFASTAHTGTSRVPSGTYQTTIKNPASLKGVWRIVFHARTDTDLLNGNKVASGRYRISGTSITFAQPAVPSGAPETCRTPGKYTFRLSGKRLRFTKVSDPCNSVRSELLSHRFIHLSHSVT
jgi:hypothetical protein